MPKIGSNGLDTDADETTRTAKREIQRRVRVEEVRIESLRAEIKLGIDALDAGDFTEVDDADLEEFLNRI